MKIAFKFEQCHLKTIRGSGLIMQKGGPHLNFHEYVFVTRESLAFSFQWINKKCALCSIYSCWEGGGDGFSIGGLIIKSHNKKVSQIAMLLKRVFTFLYEKESKHQCFVPPVGPGQLVKLGNQLFL